MTMGARQRTRSSAVALATVSSFGAPMPAQATVNSSLTVTCSMQLHRWPRSSFQDVRCRGDALGLVTGTALSGDRYSASASGSPLTFRFARYSATDGFPLIGSAQGLLITDLRSVSSPGPVTLSTFFFWTRVGGALIGSTVNTHVTMPGGQQAVGQNGVLTGGSVPTTVPLPTCGTKGLLG
jgi:hypothetical protein